MKGLKGLRRGRGLIARAKRLRLRRRQARYAGLAIRSQVLSLKERPFIQVALLSGLSGVEIVWFELLPNLLPWLGANFVNAFIAGVLAESGLSILGLGPQQDMTLGMMIYWALNYGALLQNLWWWWATPVVVLVALFLSLYLVHVGLDEVSNPRLRGQA